MRTLEILGSNAKYQHVVHNDTRSRGKVVGFEYDPDKSAENKRKHGIDFEAAQRLWADAGLVEIPARTTDEPRWTTRLLPQMLALANWSLISFGPRHFALRASSYQLWMPLRVPSAWWFRAIMIRRARRQHRAVLQPCAHDHRDSADGGRQPRNAQ